MSTLKNMYEKYSKIDSTDETTFSGNLDSSTVDNMAPQILAMLR
jgi:hypothetical protein